MNFRFSAEDATTQGAFVLKNLAKIAAVDPAAAGRTFDEVFPLALYRATERFTDVLPAGNIEHGAIRLILAPCAQGL